VLERGDERSALDSLLALDLANGFNDFLAHPGLRSFAQIRPDDRLVRDVHWVTVSRSHLQRALTGGDDLSPRRAVVRLDPTTLPDGPLEVRARPQRARRTRRGDLDRVRVEVGPQHGREIGRASCR